MYPNPAGGVVVVMLLVLHEAHQPIVVRVIARHKVFILEPEDVRNRCSQIGPRQYAAVNRVEVISLVNLCLARRIIGATSEDPPGAPISVSHSLLLKSPLSCIF